MTESAHEGFRLVQGTSKPSPLTDEDYRDKFYPYGEEKGLDLIGTTVRLPKGALELAGDLVGDKTIPASNISQIHRSGFLKECRFLSDLSNDSDLRRRSRALLQYSERKADEMSDGQRIDFIDYYKGAVDKANNRARLFKMRRTLSNSLDDMEFDTEQINTVTELVQKIDKRLA